MYVSTSIPQLFLNNKSVDKLIPFLSSASWLIIWIIHFAWFQDSKDNMNQFTHYRTDNYFPIFPSFFQSKVINITNIHTGKKLRSNQPCKYKLILLWEGLWYCTSYWTKQWEKDLIYKTCSQASGERQIHFSHLLWYFIPYAKL